VQGSSSILIAYEYADAVPPINLGKPKEAPADLDGLSPTGIGGGYASCGRDGFNDQTCLDVRGFP